jgi:hypothetical protein
MNADDLRALVVGQRYRITYQLPGQRVPHALVGKMLGYGSRNLWVSLRPHAGTTELPLTSLQSVEKTSLPVSLPVA